MAIYGDRKHNEYMEHEHDRFELRFAVDIPDINRIREGNGDEWVNVDYFATREDAIKWAMENLGADSEGRISVISSF